MDNGQLLLILLAGFAVMVMVKIPIAYALGLSSLVVIVKMGIPMTSAINSMYNSVNNYSLLAVPLFMLLAQLMDKGGITDRLFVICDAFVGHIRGGLGHVNVLISLLFGHLSGSAQADAAGIGAMIIPAMRKSGYDSGFSVAITACSSTLGVIIPPSVPAGGVRRHERGFHRRTFHRWFCTGLPDCPCPVPVYILYGSETQLSQG